jgi:flagellar hook-basal body complex protein FliE
MDIKTNSLFAQMQSMSMQASGNKLPAVGGDIPGMSGANPIGKVNESSNESSNDFGNLLTDALKTVNELAQDSGAKKTAFEMGDRSVTLAEVMIASSKSGIALDATIQVRNKFVEAYKEIMSMPV